MHISSVYLLVYFWGGNKICKKSFSLSTDRDLKKRWKQKTLSYINHGIFSEFIFGGNGDLYKKSFSVSTVQNSVKRLPGHSESVCRLAIKRDYFHAEPEQNSSELSGTNWVNWKPYLTSVFMKACLRALKL